MSDFLFHTALVGFCLGILLSTILGLNWVFAVWFLVLALVVGLVVRRGGSAVPPDQLTLLLSVGCLALALGVGRAELANWSYSNSALSSEIGNTVSLIGVIVREPEQRENTQHLYVKVDDDVILLYTDRYQSYRYGDEIKIQGKIKTAEPFATDLGRTFNYPGYLKAQGVSYVMSYGEIDILSSGNGNPFIRWLLTGKAGFMDSLETVLREPQVGLGEGLLLGVKSSLGKDWENIFRSTGLIHLVVLSGYNIALVVIFIRYIFSRLVSYRFELMLSLLGILAFSLVVGLSATVVRASLMASFIIWAKYIGRTYDVIRGLLVAGFVMLIYNPYLLPYDVGFQLSFLATLGLLLLTPVLVPWFTWLTERFGIRELVLATIATQIFVLPILLYQIGQFSLVAVLVNVLVVPIVPVVMFLTFLTGLVSLISSSLVWPFVYLTDWSLSYILLTAEKFSQLPFAAHTVTSFPFFWVVLAYAFLAYILWRSLSSDRLESPPKQTNLSHWTIVEEKDLVEQIKKRDRSNPPVFFS